ncbi:MAG TPA: hypothetical protein DD423_08265, partial [Opitutae bacterium]|nr:hypothetical protein [Opitutae bacterium]
MIKYNNSPFIFIVIPLLQNLRKFPLLFVILAGVGNLLQAAAATITSDLEVVATVGEAFSYDVVSDATTITVAGDPIDDGWLLFDGTGTLSGSGVADVISLDDGATRGVHTVTITASNDDGDTVAELTVIVGYAEDTSAAVIISPEAGFQNENFVPAFFAWYQDGEATNIVIDKDLGVTSETYNYKILQLTKGTGYYPRDASDLTFMYTFQDTETDANEFAISGNVTSGGRLTDLPTEVSVTFGINDVQLGGLGTSGVGYVDSGFSPGASAVIPIIAEFYPFDTKLQKFNLKVTDSLGVVETVIADGNLDPDLNGGEILAPIFEYPESGILIPGEYTVSAELFEDGNNSGTPDVISDDFIFEIKGYNPVPVVQISSPAVVSNVDAGEVVEIEITAAQTNANISQVEVFDGATSLGIASQISQYKFKLLYVTSINDLGLHELAAQATDDNGNVGKSEKVYLSVVTGDVPTVSIASPVTGASVELGESVAIEVTASDADGSVVSVVIFDGDTEIAAATKVGDDSYRLNLQASLAYLGRLELNARATDDRGNVSISAVASLAVVTGEVPAVSGIGLEDAAEPGTLDSDFTAADTVNITVTATDGDDGQVIAVEVYNNATGALLGAATPNGTANQYELNYKTTAVDIGVMQLEARAIDDSGNVAVSTVTEATVLASAVPVVVIDPLNDASIGTLLEVNVTATDADGLLSVELWKSDPVNGDSVYGALSPTGTANEYRYSALLTSADLGIYNLYARAFDARGNEGVSPIERFNVVTGNVAAVTITTVDDTASVLNEEVTVTITAYDNDTGLVAGTPEAGDG